MKLFWLVFVLLFLNCWLLCENVSVKEFEMRIFDHVNQVRRENSLPELANEESLVELARMHSRNMGWEGFFDHVDHEGLQVWQRQRKYFPELIHVGIGENLHYTLRSDRKYDPGVIVSDWMGSPEHRDNLLEEDYTHAGVGIFLLGSKLYTTMVFAVPVLKLLSDLPEKFHRDKAYRLVFEYLSPAPGKDLQCQLNTPDPKSRIMVSPTIYYEGSIPLKLDWTDGRHLSVLCDFSHGKGSYSLDCGWNGYFYKDMMIFKVK